MQNASLLQELQRRRPPLHPILTTSSGRLLSAAFAQSTKRQKMYMLNCYYITTSRALKSEREVKFVFDLQ